MLRIPSAWPGNDTGNFFLDLEEPNDGYYATDESRQKYTLENIQRMEKLREETKPIYDRGWAACHRAEEHPEIYAPVVKLVDGRIMHSKGSRDKKKLSNRELMALAAEYKDRLQANHPGSSLEEKEDENDSE